ncbi:MAG: DegT/DnrJ/EryC1/StrS aminotransferase family protein [Spartobacteria bacterium]|nr:DegT/DnrJ/EryC1/StrS aminotransferase family protein [Spartobacteria bacterium]
MIPHSRPTVKQDEIEAVIAALRAGHLSQGDEVRLLEYQLSAMFQNRHVAVVSSGTAALYLALKALGITSRQEVVIPSYTCNSLFGAVSLTGATSVCADVSAGQITLDCATVDAVRSSATGAVIAPHTCGFACDIDALGDLGIPVIEDCAQSIGGYHLDGAPMGSKGVVGIFSFYGTKVLPAGEGGAVITRSAVMAEKIRRWRDCDERDPDPAGFNFKMSDLCAALARARLARLDEAVRERAVIAKNYHRLLGGHAIYQPTKQPVFFRFLVKCKHGVEEVIDAARSNGVVCRRPVWNPLHLRLGGACPNTEQWHQHVLSIPLYPGLTDREQQLVCDVTGALLA